MERSTLIIGLGYEQQQGKDTTAQFMINGSEYFYDVRRYSFATPLKRELNVLHNDLKGWHGVLDYFRQFWPVPDWVQIDDNPIMDDPESPYGKQRKLLQWYGTDIMRRLDPHVWLNKTLDIIHADKPQVAIISDVRFPNEGFAMDYNVRMNRLGAPVPPDAHESENLMRGFPFDYTITYKDDDLHDLRHQALFVFDDCVARHMHDLRFDYRNTFEALVRTMREEKCSTQS